MSKRECGNRRKKFVRSTICAAVVLVLTGLYMFVPNNTLISHAGQTSREEILVLDSTTADDTFMGNYDTNYIDGTVEDWDFFAYRCGRYTSGDLLCTLLLPDRNDFSDSIHGFFGNKTPIETIDSIAIEYEAKENFVLYYGNDRAKPEYSKIVPKASDNGYVNIELGHQSDYFKIYASRSEVKIYSIKIYISPKEDYSTSEMEFVRYIPQTNYDPAEGDVLEIPVKASVSGDNFKITEYKQYTYHSFDYCKKMIDKGANPGDYALTDPVDVANYFVLFNKIPPNYGCKNSSKGYGFKLDANIKTANEVMKTFGKEYTRIVQEFSRTDGYTENLPLRGIDKKGRICYYEFDLDIDGNYSIDRRGTWRLIGFCKGMTCYNDLINVVLYTDDHYLTFREYNNYGSWSRPFDGEADITGFRHAG